jgi:hypothetical protein
MYVLCRCKNTGIHFVEYYSGLKLNHEYPLEQSNDYDMLAAKAEVLNFEV